MEYVARKMGCGRYIQGPGAVQCLGKEVVAFGAKKALIIGGKKALAAAGERLEESLKNAGVDYYIYTMTTDCTYETMDELVNVVAPEQGTDIVIGCGGGKVMDMTKGTAKRLGQKVITVPSSAATFNCWSALSVMYYPNGKPRNLMYHETEVDCAIVDTQILIEAPARLFASGVADSFAKHIEGNLCNDRNDIFTLSAPQYTSKVVSKACNDTLFLMGEKAYRDAQAHQLSDEFEKCVFAIMADAAMSGGLAGGHIAGNNEVSCVSFSHDMYDMIRRLFTEEAKGSMHGEIIGLALYGQMHHMNRPEFEINNFRRFLDALDQPKNLRELGIDPTDENLEALADEIMGWNPHTPDHRPVILEALHIIK